MYVHQKMDLLHMTEAIPLSPVALSAWQDLLRILQDEEAASFIGVVEERTVGPKRYLYDRFRLGNQMMARYLGEDTPDLRARIAKAETLRAASKDRMAERLRLVRLMRAEGLRSLDAGTGAILSAFERSGMFRLGGTLVGTNAFRLYEPVLGVRMTLSDLALTNDIDIASFERLSMVLDDRVNEDTGGVLRNLSFAPVPSLDGNRVWRWKQTKRETLVGFLTPAFGEEGIRDLPALGVSAQALHYLNYLIAGPIKAVALYRAGILVQIPRPERFAIHKLIVADRRRDGADSLKARKDRAQAAFLIHVLAEERPDELAEAWEDARARGPRWRARIDSTLARLPVVRDRLAGLGLA